MTKRAITKACKIILLAILFKQTSAQSLIDIGAGASTMDSYSSNLAFRQQINDNFRVGFEIQYGAPKYRFVEAKPFEKGYAWSLSVPLSFKITEQDRIRLDGFFRPGFRFQGIIDPDNNGVEDSLLSSRAVLFEAGLLVNVKLTEKLNLNSGVLLPAAFEVAPTSLFEYMGTPNFVGGFSYLATPKTIVFIKGITGPGFGANGDTYKYFWSAQAGVRLAFGKNTTTKSLLLDPSF
jgi:hypothetical protein